MISLLKPFKRLLNKDYSKYVTTKTSLVSIFILITIFFYPIISEGKIALPVDALVGAHVPWTEISWPDYPAGVPIKNLEITDAFSQFYPWRSLVGEFWREGKMPLWNNFMFSGTPFLAALHSASIYPLNIVYLLFTNIAAWNALIILQIGLSMLFMFLFLKEITKDNLASVFGSITFAFSGYMIAWLEFATGGHAGLWLPLLLLLQIKYIKSEKVIYFFTIPIVIFFILTAGDFQVPFYSLAVYVLFSVYLSFVEHKKSRYLFGYLSALVFGILLSLIQWIPTFELFARSIRTNDPYIKEYYYGIAHFEKLVNFIWPDFFGNVVTRNYWGKFGYHEYLAFAGSITLGLLGFSLFVKKTKIEKFFLGVLIVSLLFLFPTPLAFLPYSLKIPGLGTSSASRIIYLVDFCLAVLSAFAVTKLKRTNLINFSRSVFYLLVVSLGVAVGIATVLNIFSRSGLDVSMYSDLKVAIKNIVPSSLVLVVTYIFVLIFRKVPFLKVNNIKILLVMLLIAEMFRFGWKNTPFSKREFVFPVTKITSYLSENTNEYRISGGIPLNLFIPFGIKSLEGYDPIYPQINSEWFSLINSKSLNALSGRYGLVHDFSSPLLNLSSVKYVVDYRKNSLGQLDKDGGFAQGVTDSKYKEVFEEGRVKVFENTEALPIVWLSGDFIIGPNKEEIHKLLLGNENPNSQIILNKNPNIEFYNKNPQYSVADFKIGLNEVNFNLESESESLLFLSQTFDSGWRAYVNGSETEIFQADYLYQSIVVPEGKSFIHFVYEPKSFKIGKNVFIATAILLVFITVYLKFHRDIKDLNGN